MGEVRHLFRPLPPHQHDSHCCDSLPPAPHYPSGRPSMVLHPGRPYQRCSLDERGHKGGFGDGGGGAAYGGDGQGGCGADSREGVVGGLVSGGGDLNRCYTVKPDSVSRDVMYLLCFALALGSGRLTENETQRRAMFVSLCMNSLGVFSSASGAWLRRRGRVQ